MAESEFSFPQMMKEAVREVFDIIKTEQRVAVKLNAIFGLIAAFLIFVLFVPSALHEIIDLIQAIRGKEVGETPAWALVIAILTVPLYFLASVWITNRPSRQPRTPRHS
jgi:H+/Cl- antiporter ClcA